MKNKIKILISVIALFFYQSQIFGQSPNYTGTWVLNLDKSQLEDRPNGLTGSLFIIKQDVTKFRLTRYHLFGDKKNKIKFKMVADGKTRSVKILFRGKLEQNVNSLQATLWRKNFSNIVTYKFENDQNELIADEVYTGNPKNHHNIWAFERGISK